MSSSQPPYNGVFPTCQRCGKLLMPNEPQCVRCGMHNPPMQFRPTSGQSWQSSQPSSQQWQSGQSQPQGGNSLGGGQPWGQTPAQSDMNSLSRRSFGLDQPGLGGQQVPFPPVPTVGSGNNFPQMSFPGSVAPLGNGKQLPLPLPFPGQNGDQTVAAPLGGIGQGQGFQSNGVNGAPFSMPPAFAGQDFKVATPKKKSPISPGILIALAVIMIVSIVGAGFLISQSNVPPPEPLPRATGQVIFQDQFNNNTNGWDVTSDPTNYSVKVGGNALILAYQRHRLLPELVPGDKNKNLEDYRLTVDGALSRGDSNNGYGVMTRCSVNKAGDVATYYGFEIYGNGTYVVYKKTVDGKGNPNRINLAGGNNELSPLINKGTAVNHLAVITKGDTLKFYVNNQLLASTKDGSYKSGMTALFVSNLPSVKDGAEATFNNLVITKE